jgi:hypothetical protein
MVGRFLRFDAQEEFRDSCAKSLLQAPFSTQPPLQTRNSAQPQLYVYLLQQPPIMSHCPPTWHYGSPLPIHKYTIPLYTHRYDHDLGIVFQPPLFFRRLQETADHRSPCLAYLAVISHMPTILSKITSPTAVDSSPSPHFT